MSSKRAPRLGWDFALGGVAVALLLLPLPLVLDTSQSDLAAKAALLALLVIPPALFLGWVQMRLGPGSVTGMSRSARR